MLIKKNLFYTLNYKPFLGYKKNINNKNLVYCKNFFVFFLILENLILSLKKSSSNYRVKISKTSSHNISFLRAPNKYKKAQVKVNIIRYNVTFECTHTYLFNSFYFFNSKKIFMFINFLFNFINFFESSLFYLKKKKLIVKLPSYTTLNMFEL